MISEELINALRDENGLKPTDNALTVIEAVLVALDSVDEAWENQRDALGDKTMPPLPTLDAYAAAVTGRLDHLKGH